MNKPATTPIRVRCDICEARFTLPTEMSQAGLIYGLLVCTQCIEDSLYARADEPRCEVGLVGSGGGRS